MALGSRITRQSPCVNTLIDLIGELDELAGQGHVRGSNAGSNDASTKASTLPEASTLPFVPSTSKDLFTKFMKVFMETTHAQAQALAEPRERALKASTSETYSGKSYMDCYHFCQQCEDYFKTSGATRMNCTPFTITFFHGLISLRWAQHKQYQKRATPITWLKFKTFL